MLGRTDGADDGDILPLGDALGNFDGTADGSVEGVALGASDGAVVGTTLGAVVGIALGESDGMLLGIALGTSDGGVVGTTLGGAVGIALGKSDGILLGIALGTSDGAIQLGKKRSTINGRIWTWTAVTSVTVGSSFKKTSTANPLWRALYMTLLPEVPSNALVSKEAVKGSAQLGLESSTAITPP